MKGLIAILISCLGLILGALPAQGAMGPLLESALEGKAPASLLPFWHDYPWRKIDQAEEWTRFTHESLERDGDALIRSEPGDIGFYCPAYPRLNREKRLVFWTRFISVLAELESTYDSSASTKEETWISTGLMMLSLGSAQLAPYQCDMIRKQSDLSDWKKNIACSIRIMSNFMNRDGVLTWFEEEERTPLWTGLARYWGPLRDMRLQADKGRLELFQVVNARRAAWQQEGREKTHPALKDQQYRKVGEKRFERLLRLMNAMPICYSSSGY
ncbi:MAG: hypothetical protein KF789_13370 [Bdellovibrionaceae bacterium]|nr:hypothetical protein [Pseudobdellovibrionaceae bacterium]